MSKKRTIGILSVILSCALLMLIGRVLSIDTNASVLDIDGNVIAQIYYQDGQLQYVYLEEGLQSYVEITIAEAIEQVMKTAHLKKEAAEKRLVKKEMQIQTAFRPEFYESLKNACLEKTNITRCDMAIAISDVNGKMIACYSASTWDDAANYVIEPTYAASVIKPLSTYAPAIEDGLICWSSKYMDTPYSQVENSDGSMSDWPQNLEPYTNVEQTVKTAVLKSNNTIAVKILKEYGVQKACDFLADNFDITVTSEHRMMKESGEDEILGNIALGYLREGVTVKEMLGAYQIFANEGIYRPAYAVTEIRTAKKELYYEHIIDGKRVISAESAYIMNRLLNTVIDANGTGADAAINGVDICGKTGTSSGYKDNWFVGITPEYVCTVWYGIRENDYIENRNEASGIFREVMLRLPHDENIEYPVSDKVQQLKYCEHTGKLANEHCLYTSMGYYDEARLPEQCDCE